MRAIHITSLLFASAVAVMAQNATVENAALYQPTIYPELVSPILTSGGAAFPFSEIELFGVTPNIISPRMLAVLSYSAPASPALPVTAVLYLRPSGSTTLIPVSNIINAVPGAITFVVPGYTPLGGAELLYQIDNGPTQWTTVTVVQSSFAFFRNGAGGPAIAQAIPPTGASSTVGLATPIRPGQTLTLTGSGLGYGTTVTATIGGVPAPVTYAGPNGTAAGHDQILLQVPAGVAPGCYVLVSVTYNTTTLTTTISETADGSPCKHPWQLSLNDLQTLDSGASIAAAQLDLGTQLSVVTAAAASRSESANLNLTTVTGAQLATYFQPAPAAPGCYPPAAASIALVNGEFIGTTATLIPDLGSSVTLQSPTTAIQLAKTTGGYTSNLPGPVDGPLTNLPVPAIAGGKWTFQSSGGADLGPSSFGFTLPAPVQLGAGVPVVMNHTQDQTITWNGAAFDAGATALVSVTGSGSVSCTAPANAGTLSIPAALLSGFGAGALATLTIGISEAGAYLPHAEFQTKEGNSLIVFVPFSSSDTRPVFFQ